MHEPLGTKSYLFAGIASASAMIRSSCGSRIESIISEFLPVASDAGRLAGGSDDSMMTEAETFSIGAIAKRTGLRVSALRYYESRGLITPMRRVHGRRRYDDSVFEAIALVQLARDAGFTLSETRALIAGFERDTPASARWQAMARRKLVDMVRRIEEAQRMKTLLEGLLRCRCQTLSECVRTRTEALRVVHERIQT